MKYLYLACSVILACVLSACLPPLMGDREYAAETTAPVGLDYESHPDAADFQALLDGAVARSLPGVALLVRNPAGLWIGASGQRDINADLPFQPFTRSRIGSVTKTFTAVAVLLVAEDGLLSLDDPIADHLSAAVAAGVVNSAQITVRQLLNHTSGLPREPWTVSASLALGTMADDPYTELTIEDYLAALYNEPALFAPGEAYSYSNFGYVLLGLILEEATGQDQWEVVQTRILDPLGLTDTFFDPVERSPAGLARGYADLYGNGSLTDTSDWDGLHPLDAEGGIVTTVYDLYRFLDELFYGNLLLPASLAEMLNGVAVSPDAGSDTYGLGIGWGMVDGKSAYNHVGLVTGYLAAYYVYPDQQAIVTVVVNGSAGDVQAELGALMTERLPPLLE